MGMEQKIRYIAINDDVFFLLCLLLKRRLGGWNKSRKALHLTFHVAITVTQLLLYVGFLRSIKHNNIVRTLSVSNEIRTISAT